MEQARILTEAGVIEVRCTLEKHEDGKHYDSVFCLEWRSA